MFAAIYKIVPDVHLEWRDVILGGAVTSLLFTVGKLLLGVYLGRASYTSMYGAAASVVVAIAWFYYSSQIFFLGAELTHSFARRYGSQPKSNPKQWSNPPPIPPLRNSQRLSFLRKNRREQPSNAARRDRAMEINWPEIQ